MHLERMLIRKIMLCYMQKGPWAYWVIRDGNLLDKYIGLLSTKVFLKRNINVFIHIVFLQLFLSLLTLYWSEKRFNHHSKIKLCTTKEFFLIESIEIYDDLNNENQYLCLQLNCLNQIKCHKNHFFYLKLVLLLSGDISLNPGPIQNIIWKRTGKLSDPGAYIL